MPCMDGGPRPQQINNNLQERLNISEAVICAIHNELMTLNNYVPGFDIDTFYRRAMSNGNVDIVSHIQKHIDADKERLAVELGRFSAHELEMIKRLLIEK